MKKTILIGLIAVAAFTIGLAPAQGASRFWFTGDGDWFDESSAEDLTWGRSSPWKQPDTVPGAANNAYLYPEAGNSVYTLTFGINNVGEIEHDVLRFNHRWGISSTITLDLCENILNVTSGSYMAFEVDGTTGGEFRELIVSNGTMNLTGGGFRIGSAVISEEGALAILTIDNGATLNSNRTDERSYVGFAHKAEMNILNGTLDMAGYLRIGHTYEGSSGEGNVFVGEQGTLIVRGEVLSDIGNAAKGEMHVNGGDVTFTNHTFSIGTSAGGNGTLLVDNGGTVTVGANQRTLIGGNSDGELRVNNGTVVFEENSFTVGSGSASGTLIVENGGTLTANNTNAAGVTVGDGTNGVMRINNGGTVNVSTGGAWNSSTVGTNGGHAELYVDGSGLLNFSSESVVLSGSGSTSKTEVTNGGTIQGVRALRFAWWLPPTEGGPAATLLIEGSRMDGETEVFSSVTADRIDISREDTATVVYNAEGIVTVRDGGRLIAQSASSGDYFRLVGHGTLEIDGGTVEVDITRPASAGVQFTENATYKLTLHDPAAVPFSVTNTGVDLNNNNNPGGGATLVLSLTDGFTANEGDVFTILDYSGQSLEGQFSNYYDQQRFTLSEGGNDYIFDFFYNYNDEDQIAIQVIPEPHSLGLILLGLGGLAYHRRRRA